MVASLSMCMPSFAAQLYRFAKQMPGSTSSVKCSGFGNLARHHGQLLQTRGDLLHLGAVVIAPGRLLLVRRHVEVQPESHGRKGRNRGLAIVYSGFGVLSKCGNTQNTLNNCLCPCSRVFRIDSASLFPQLRSWREEWRVCSLGGCEEMS